MSGVALIAVRVDTSALRLGVVPAVSAMGHVAGLLVLNLVVDVTSVARSGDGATGVAGLVAGTGVVVVVGGESAGADASGTELSLLLGVLVLTGEETAAAAGARGVVVGGAGAKALLLLVVTDEGDLEGGGAEEEESGDDGAGEDGRVVAAGVAERDRIGDVAAVVADIAKAAGAEAAGAGRGRAGTKRGVDGALAGASTVAGEHGNGKHAADKADVEEDGEEGQEGNTAKAAGQQDGEDEVEDCSAADALDSLFPCWDL